MRTKGEAFKFFTLSENPVLYPPVVSGNTKYYIYMWYNVIHMIVHRNIYVLTKTEKKYSTYCK